MYRINFWINYHLAIVMPVVVFPIQNKKITTFKGPQWYISDAILMRTLSDEDYGAIIKYDNRLVESSMKPGQKCIYWDFGLEEPDSKSIEKVASAIKFSINTFIEKDALLIPFCIVLRKQKVTKVEKVIFFPYYGDVFSTGMEDVRLRAGTLPIMVQETFKLANTALSRNPSCFLMIKRYNMSLLRSDPLDQIIDTAISLEHIINERTELSFRLCLIISICVEGDPKNRNKIFNIFKKFYEARSAVVHGVLDSDDKKIKTVINSLDEIRRYGAVAMLYYFKFLENNKPGKWRDHYMGRLLNSENSVLA